MSHYIHHYWQVYFEYVNLMKDLSYRQIPLGLISNFYQYISPEVRKVWKIKRLATTGHNLPVAARDSAIFLISTNKK